MYKYKESIPRYCLCHYCQMGYRYHSFKPLHPPYLNANFSNFTNCLLPCHPWPPFTAFHFTIDMISGILKKAIPTHRK